MIQFSQLARTAILKIIDEEGGWIYTDHPIDKDRGTYAGVRYKVFADYNSDNNIGAILSPAIYKDMAVAGTIKDIIIDIYYAEYYQKLNIEKLPDVLKMSVFSCGVNTGQRRAGIILQRTVNEISIHRLQVREGVVSQILKEDGIIGDKTLAAVEDICFNVLYFAHNAAVPLSDNSRLTALVNMDKLRNTFIKNWIKRYVNITVDVPEYTEFLSGWFNRAAKYWVL